MIGESSTQPNVARIGHEFLSRVTFRREKYTVLSVIKAQRELLMALKEGGEVIHHILTNSNE